MKYVAEETLQEALAAFDFGRPVVSVQRYGGGHINDTFRVFTQPAEYGPDCYVLQRMSTAAFKEPQLLMNNVMGITQFLREKIAQCGGDPDREAMTVLRARDGGNCFTDSLGGVWRVFVFIRDSMCCESADTPELFEASAYAFGKFQRMLSDYPAETLYETIPRFHDTVDRLQKLKDAVAAAPEHLLAQCREEVEFALKRESDCAVALDAQRAGILPLRVTHNDTKLDNVLFDCQTGKGLCVIDLDTTMPGLSINDFGDSIRFGANHNAEDEPDLTKVNFDLSLYEVYTRGYLEGVAGCLTQAELRYLPWGAKLMTLECGIRFLTDYLQGDTYFRIHYPQQNLIRCRTQFKLVQDMEEKWEDMHRVIEKYTAL